MTAVTVAEPRETLPGSIELDRTSGLPLADQQTAILQCVLAYLSLPYSVAEHGCGKKTSLILHELHRLGLPLHALARGMVMEADMSPRALAAADRDHALSIDNPLVETGDLHDEKLRRYLETSGAAQCVGDRLLRAGPYTLHHEPRVQFEIARSHVFPLIAFWDAERGEAVERVLDPTLRGSSLIALDEIRELVHAPAALLFTAPPCGIFRLVQDQLTPAQERWIADRLGSDVDLEGLPADENAALVRALCGAEPGSIGDPDHWTYANNVTAAQMEGVDDEHDATQRDETGLGEPLRALRRQLVAARVSADSAGADEARDGLRREIDRTGLHQIMQRDALYSERRLEPLAELTIALVGYRALSHLAASLRDGHATIDFLSDPAAHRELRGLGVRQRRRIDRMGMASTTDDGEIDGRALHPGFVNCAVETVQQMNAAGLTVCVDKVGNLHGLALDGQRAARLRDGSAAPEELVRDGVAFLSHIDTVADAGKFDGRLGVTAGIEAAQTIDELRRWFELELLPDCRPPLLVTAINGEEMTFTGRGVSMPGSAAVTGRASVENVHAMTDSEGRTVRDRMLPLLARLAAEQRAGRLTLANDLAGRSGDDLFAACFDPPAFYTPHTYERHIEQGPVLDRAGVPAALVSTIMGIRQEDFTIRGARAEASALEFGLRMRELTLREPFLDTRATVGVIERAGASEPIETPAFRIVLEGQQNHAGGTATADRCDPGVAAARLLRFATEQWGRGPGKDGPPIVGDLELLPGSARNVIPGIARLTIALAAGAVEFEDEHEVLHALRGFAHGELSACVPRGGEGIRESRITTTSFVNPAPEARVTLDLRDAEQATIEAFVDELDTVCSDLEQQFDVAIERNVEQQLCPQHIERSDQALVLERSYGGSHNPAETELTADLTRGCILQLATLIELARRPQGDPIDLVATIDALIPQRWKERKHRFVSGGLHDTCNVAARAHTDLK